MNPDLFEPFDRLIEVTVNGQNIQVPENNTILRCLQYLWMDAVSYADLCWNGDCANCKVRIETDGREKDALACIAKVSPGMSIDTSGTDIPLGEDPDPGTS